MISLHVAAGGAEKDVAADILPAAKWKDALKEVLRAPTPEYPYQARRQRLTGSGIALIKVDQPTGKVIKVLMYVSTGQPILDQVTIDTLYRWQFRPGTWIKGAKVPITFTLLGGAWGGDETTKESSMDEALARYLGRGTVVFAPIPRYPGSTWDFREGRGVYELHVTKAGTVSSVKILKSSRDETFDHAATHALSEWRLSRGPLIIELPLRFVLTPDSYSVSLAR